MRTRYAVAARLTGPPTDDRAPHPATVVDLVWAHAVTADQLDHVRVRAPLPVGELELLVLLRAETTADAIRITEGLLDRARRSPVLSRWLTDDFSVSALPLAALDG